ncbi:MAG: lipase family protein [Tannerellaceae bacterium]|jgi:pimeloyl-ACP methyl ester carboxylesterase|nr:lipase family protein [Tannerellaceae bacterium]
MKKIEHLFIQLLSLWLVACTEANKPIVEEQPSFFESIVDSVVYPANEILVQTLGEGYAKLSSALSGRLADIRVDVLHYYTLDPEGKRTLASGIVSYPAQGEIDNVVLAEHATVGSSREAPSEAKFVIESILSSLGSLVIVTDYIGYGTTSALPHTYLHVGSTAQASIDMFFAAKEYMKMLGKRLPDEIYVTGYSQGGASALAVQKTVEANHADSVHIKKVIAGGGPYDLLALFDDVETRKLSQTAFIPMAIIGLNYGDKLGLDFGKLFNEPLLSNYHEWIISKKYTLSEINSFLGSDFLNSSFFSDETTNPEIAKLRSSLVKNSLTDWTPKAPIRLLHGTKDTTVPFYCSQHAYDSFKAKGCKVDLFPIPGADHGGAVALYVIDVVSQIN